MQFSGLMINKTTGLWMVKQARVVIKKKAKKRPRHTGRDKKNKNRNTHTREKGWIRRHKVQQRTGKDREQDRTIYTDY